MESLLVRSQRYDFHAECTKSTGRERRVHRAAKKSQMCPEDDLNFRIELQVGQDFTGVMVNLNNTVSSEK